MDTRLKEILRNRGNEQQLATILAAVRASARRDEELLAAVQAGAQRTTAQLEHVSGAVASSARRNEKLLATVQAGARRNEKFIVAAAQSGERRIDAVEARVRRDGAKLDGIKEEVDAARERAVALDKKVSAIGTSMVKKTRKESARDLKRTNLVNHEVVLDRVEAEPVACGSQGVVYQGEYMGDAVALKKISLASLTATKRQQMVSQFAEEVSITIRLRSPRTVAVLGVVTTDSSFLGLVMEYMPGGSIRQAIDGAEVDAELKCNWASDIALGMQYLYSCGVQHRDLKSHNCLLTSDARAKVSDFGLGRCDALKTSTTTLTMKNGDGLAGTPAFMAPELLKDNVFT